MKANEIRKSFLEYFEKNGHRVVRSSSLVPHGDPTLLFTNAGMNQFKDVFLGVEKRDYARAASSQKCVRAGGKHNDLENVGFTNRHHTFFEMLGNFSFGDYFKKEAIAFAWELVTKHWGVSKDKLYCTVFKGEEGIPRDSEAAEHWLGQGVAKERVYEFGAKDNFWAMGDTGPCGPCSEIHYDMGAAASDAGHTDCAFGCECGRYMEIWNLVFMQFNRDGAGKLAPLPKPCVDTGMGLERIATVLQGKISNYETDLFELLIRRGEELTGAKYGGAAESDASLRIIADHSRATTFLISDGVLPSNEGRGYVLRKILRRAIRHGRLLGKGEPFLGEMVYAVRDLMKGAYPELEEHASHVRKIVVAEEERFARTEEIGLRRLQERFGEAVKIRRQDIDMFLEAQEGAGRAVLLDKLEALAAEKRLANLTDDELGRQIESVFGRPLVPKVLAELRQTLRKKPQLDGEKAFQLYDTFGVPLDEIKDAAREQGIEFDTLGFERSMAAQRARARASWKGGSKEAASPAYAKLAETFKTEPDFYFATTAKDCRIEAIVTKGGAVGEVAAGQEAEIVLDRTAIYAESGGQVADTGRLMDNALSQELAEVRGAYYPVAGLVAHRILAKEALRVGDRVAAVAEGERRGHVARNHTGTHLVHAALRNILGTHVKQAGSLNAPDHLRFDFTHFTGVAAEELRDIEQQVNEQIRKNAGVATDITSIEKALASGALAFFGDKYPEHNVRVVTIPDGELPAGFYSKELCGGTHVRQSGDIGVFKITSEQSVAAGVRRIEAVTGVRAVEQYQAALERLRRAAGLLNVGEEDLEGAIERMAGTVRQLEKQLEEWKRKSAHSKVDDLLAGVREVGGVKVLAAEVADADRESLRQMVDVLRQKMGSGVVALGTAEDGKVALIAGVTKDLVPRVHAGKIIQVIAKEVGGSGGGRPDLAEAGGKDTGALKRALDRVYEVVGGML